jgi:hypothetical protein
MIGDEMVKVKRKKTGRAHEAHALTGAGIRRR